VSFYQQAGISKFMGLALQSISNHSEWQGKLHILTVAGLRKKS
jgi:hypothetical protein